jgi:2,4-dienoyl-CoA reductase-like NADH-dependent reductase (Old Yellow Enzyme family)
MLLEHYRLMAQSGVAIVVVENSTVDYPDGSGSTRTLRADTDDNLDGLKRLAETIKKAGALLTTVSRKNLDLAGVPRIRQTLTGQDI